MEPTCNSILSTVCELPLLSRMLISLAKVPDRYSADSQARAARRDHSRPRARRPTPPRRLFDLSHSGIRSTRHRRLLVLAGARPHPQAQAVVDVLANIPSEQQDADQSGVRVVRRSRSRRSATVVVVVHNRTRCVQLDDRASKHDRRTSATRYQDLGRPQVCPHEPAKRTGRDPHRERTCAGRAGKR